ncbi:MAG: magnesium transporter [Planctomycetes bacterium RBG_16_64_12]|nr:MAG: magnesium transporter [Planctomycetes bacterium RBG_16_64_12]
MPNTLYLPELREMLATNDEAGLREFCVALHPARTADYMQGLTAEEAWAVLGYADLPLRAEIFGFFEEPKQVEVVEAIDRAEIAKFIGHLPPDDRVDLLNEVNPTVVAELMPMIPVEERRDIQRLQSYPEGTAGAEMTTEFARLREESTVGGALAEVSRQAEQLETIYYLYVVDAEDHLRGLVSARQLVSAMGKPNTRIGDLMERNLITVNVSEDQEEVAQKVAHFNLMAIPVVDDGHHMLGIITHDDVLDVMVEEATEDAHLIAAVAPLEEGYLETGVFSLAWKRGIWLTILFFTALLTSSALTKYEPVLESIPWLVLFLPLVLSTGGNSGNQSATLTIIALSTSNITLRDWWRVVRRELATGLLLGGFLGAIGYLCALLVLWMGNVAIREGTIYFAACVLPVALLLIVVSSTLTGSLLPLLFKRLGLDPALMSNPFVSGMIDVVGIIIYMTVAGVMLSA